MSECSLLLLLSVATCLLSSIVFATPILAPAHQEGGSQPKSHSRYAYVTLQYGDYYHHDEYWLGTRVLGLNLLDTGTTMDRVVLCDETVSDKTKSILVSDGWIVKPIHQLLTLYDEKGTYFRATYSKLLAWNLTEYERVVYLDSDILIMSNLDRLFKCGSFCAASRNSDLFNTGVMVIKPSAEVFRDLIKKAPIVPSYNNGDQGFINAYFKDVIYTEMFNISDSTEQQKPMRLSSGFNAHPRWYYFNSRWDFEDQDKLFIIHYTLGPVKPWVWWAYRLFDLNWKWTKIRKRITCVDDAMFPPIFWAPYPLILLVYAAFRLCYKQPRVRVRKIFNTKYFASFIRKHSHFFPLPVLLLSYYLAFAYVVPTSMLPSQAEYVFWLWSNFFLLLSMGSLCLTTASQLQDLTSQSISRKLVRTLLLFAILSASHAIHALFPLTVTQFRNRVRVFLALSVGHIIVGQVTGQAVIGVWSRSIDLQQ